MKITILTYGSRGDVQPFLALAIGLQQAGHIVTLAAPHRFSTLVSPHPIRFVPLAGDPHEISLGLNAAGANVYRMVASMRDYIMGIAPQVVAGILDASADADVLVHSFLFTTGAHSLARQLGIPDVSIQTFPMFAPTSDYPNVAFPPLGRPGNFLSHWLATQVFWFGGNNGFRQIQHLLPDSFPRKLSWPFDPTSSTPLVFAISPSMIPPSVDWARPVQRAGYFFLDDEGYQPIVDLSRFLQAGPPPVCVSFGSMVHRDAERAGRIFLDVFARTGSRAIVLTGWGGWKPDRVPENMLYLDKTPHSWLFPRCSAVIHHGGAGTTAAVLRAGIPEIVIPHAADQPFWGRRVFELGVGPRPIPIQNISIENIICAIAESDGEAMKAKARQLGEQIRAENGVSTVVDLIERVGNRALS